VKVPKSPCVCILYLLQAIKRTVDKKTVEVYGMFNEELNAVKKELTQKNIPPSPSHPKFAGQALWARQLKRRIERSMSVCVTNLCEISVFVWYAYLFRFAYTLITSVFKLLSK